MLGVLCARPRPWLLTSLSLSYAHGSGAAPSYRLIRSPLPPFLLGADRREQSVRSPAKSSAAASIWHAILPSYWQRWRTAVLNRHEAAKMGEGSWNVAWDARPARWLHHPESAWLLFGACACLAAPELDSKPDSCLEVKAPAAEFKIDASDYGSCNYKVTGVVADGRCLFRAIAHMACLRKGEEAPDENRQMELADELRAQVAEELLKRRTEVEGFLGEDFDMYVKRIQRPYVWGGEPELLMASHVLRTPISVFKKETKTGSLTKIKVYGDVYSKDDVKSINVLFHGYGHYDILEMVPDSC